MNHSSRPRSIKFFAVAFMAMAVGSAVHNIFTPQYLQARIDALFQSGDWLVALFVLTLVLRLAIATFLVWLVYVRASKVARWITVVFAVGRLLRAGEAWTALQQGNVDSMIWVLISVVAVFAASCLFLPESRYWFAIKGRSAETDAAAFE